MMYITFSHGSEFSWHIGETVPEFDVNKVCTVQADCDELDAIARMFPTMPIPKGKRVCRFFGDYAKMIAGNLIPQSDRV